MPPAKYIMCKWEKRSWPAKVIGALFCSKVRLAPSLLVFRRQVKTFIFKHHFNC
uniref:Uncharacterized protein n=1 Tax=Varanus komodoensis TaxID=61221 RepID=A0A8D2LAM4_VARKO